MKAYTAPVARETVSFHDQKILDALGLFTEFFRDRPRSEGLELSKKIEFYSLLSPRIEPLVQSIREKYMIESDRPMDMSDFFAIAEAEGIRLADGPAYESIADELRSLDGVFLKHRDGTPTIWLKSFIDRFQTSCSRRSGCSERFTLVALFETKRTESIARLAVSRPICSPSSHCVDGRKNFRFSPTWLTPLANYARIGVNTGAGVLVSQSKTTLIQVIYTRFDSLSKDSKQQREKKS